MEATIRKVYKNGESKLLVIYGNTPEDIFNRLGEHIRDKNVINADFLSTTLQNKFIKWLRKKSYGEAYDFFND